jgi:hypothetical protein
MAKSINYHVASGALDQIGARSRPASTASPAAAYSVNWTFGPSSDREPGNACIGIAIGCALSLPIWIGVAVCYYLLS